MPLTSEQRERLLRDLIAAGNEMAASLRLSEVTCWSCHAELGMDDDDDADRWERLLDDARAEGLLPP